MAGICATREQNQQGVQEQVLNVKILSLAEEAPEPHIAGAWASIYAIWGGKTTHCPVPMLFSRELL